MIIRAFWLGVSICWAAVSASAAEPARAAETKEDFPFDISALLRNQIQIMGATTPTKTGSCAASTGHRNDRCEMVVSVDFSTKDPNVCIATVDGILPVPSRMKPKIVWTLNVVDENFKDKFEFEEQFGILILKADGGDKQIDFNKSHGHGDGSGANPDKKRFHLHNKNLIVSKITYFPIVLYTGGPTAVMCQAVDPIIQNDGGG